MTPDERQVIETLRADVAAIRQDVRRIAELLTAADTAEEAGQHLDQAADLGT